MDFYSPARHDAFLPSFTDSYMPRLRYDCGHSECTMWHGWGSAAVKADRSLLCPGVLERRRSESKTFTCQHVACGESFTIQGKGSNGQNKFCSSACRKKDWVGPHSAVCENCGKSFPTARIPGSAIWPRFCSRECLYPNPAHVAHDFVTRAAFYGVEYDRTVKRAGVMARDNWTCGLCDHAIPDVPYSKYDYNPEYGTVDHILPMSKGGAHVWSNVQAAHHMCNVVKGNRAEPTLTNPDGGIAAAWV